MSMLWLKIDGKVPAKANTYQIVTRKGRCTLKKADDVATFEQRLTGIALQLRQQLGGTPFPQQPVALTLIWHREAKDGRRRDLTNIAKAAEDAITKAKLWNDDSQVSHCVMQKLYDAKEGGEWLEILIQEDPLNPQKVSRR